MSKDKKLTDVFDGGTRYQDEEDFNRQREIRMKQNAIEREEFIKDYEKNVKEFLMKPLQKIEGAPMKRSALVNIMGFPKEQVEIIDNEVVILSDEELEEKLAKVAEPETEKPRSIFSFLNFG